MKAYLKNFLYHFLSLFDAVINLIGAVFGSRRVSDMGDSFLEQCEFDRIDQEITQSRDNRLNKMEEAQNKMRQLILDAEKENANTVRPKE